MLLAVVQTARAQGLPASLNGIVSDPSKAVVPGADVTLTQESTGAIRKTTSNEEGYFSIVGIPAGTYTVTVDLPGFNTWKRTGLVLHAGDKISLPDIVLTVSSAGQTIEVLATAAAVVPTDTGEKAHVIAAREIENLAVLGRSADELLKILPGVVNPSGDPGNPPGLIVKHDVGIGDYNVNGLRNTQMANTSDGANVLGPSCKCGSYATPNVDFMQEVKVQTSNSGAENALGPLVFNAISKSGTSEFHGTAYFYGRHSKLNSRDWRSNFLNTPKPTDSFYYPGFAIGGPLTKGRDKLFFFVGVEHQHQNRDLGVRQATVPTQAMRSGDFSDAAYIQKLNGYDVNTVPSDEAGVVRGGKISPAAFDKGGQVLLNLLPLPNLDPARSNGFNFASNIINPEHRNQQLVRIDDNISDNTKLYVRFNHETEASPSPYTLWWNNSNDVPWPGKVRGDYQYWSVSTSLIHVLDPTTTNELVFGYTHGQQGHKITEKDKVSRSALGYPHKGIFKNTTDVVPNFTDWGGGVADFIQPGGIDSPGIFGHQGAYSISNNFSKVMGTHTLKLGAFFETTYDDETTTLDDRGLMAPSTWGGNSTGNAYADLLLGRIADYSETTPNLVGYYRGREWAGYAQDSWKVSRRLTIEAGARFQHLGWWHDTKGRSAGFDPKRYDPAAPITAYSGLVSESRGWDGPKAILDMPALVVTPRFGFAYDLTGKGNTVIRGGGGVFKHTDRNGDLTGTIANPPLAQNVYLCCGLELKDIDAVDPKKNVQKSNLRVLAPNEDTVPTTYSWSLTLSQRLPAATVLETSYVGNSSSHQIFCTNCGQNLNAVPEGAMFGFPKGGDPNAYRPFQSYGSILLLSHGLSQNYNSLQVTAKRQTGRIGFTAAYTFSKALGVGGATYGTPADPFNHRRRSYGVLPYDRTHNLAVSYNVFLPGSFVHPLAKGVINGWQVSGISQLVSGAPLGVQSDFAGPFVFSGTMANGEDITPINVNGTPDTPARPRLTCDPRDGLADGQYANPACFVAPLPGKNGMYRMPYMKTPAFQNHDLSLFKNWEFTEDKRLQFRISAYNFLNHPIPAFVGGDPGLAINFVKGVPDEKSLKNFGRTTWKRGRRLTQFAFKFYF